MHEKGILDFAEHICHRTDLILARDMPELDAERFWETRNLWEFAVRVAWTKGQIFYRGVLSECKQDRSEPAANLWRSLSEITDTVAYWCDHEDQVKDWVEWGFSREYYWRKDMLDYDPVDSTVISILESQQDSIMRCLGGIPAKRSDTWKSRNELLSAWEVSDEYRKSLYRMRQRFPSAAVHFHPTDFGLGSAIILAMAPLDILILAQLILKSCCDRRILGPEADEIVLSIDEYWQSIKIG